MRELAASQPRRKIKSIQGVVVVRIVFVVGGVIRGRGGESLVKAGSWKYEVFMIRSSSSVIISSSCMSCYINHENNHKIKRNNNRISVGVEMVVVTVTVTEVKARVIR